MLWQKSELEQMKQAAYLNETEDWIFLFEEILTVFSRLSSEKYCQFQKSWDGKIISWCHPFVFYMEHQAEIYFKKYGLKKDGNFTKPILHDMEELLSSFTESTIPEWRNPQQYKEQFLKYPMIARILTIRTRTTLETLESALVRMFQDKEEIGKYIFDSERIEIQNIKMLETDFHGKETGVFQVATDHGKFIYKARSVASFSLLNTLIIAWCPKELQKVRYLDKKDYGYVEYFVNERPDKERLDEYLRSWGALYALTVAAHTTDLHPGNFIIKNNKPVFIDAETFITPQTYAEQSENDLQRILNRGVFCAYGSVNNPAFQSESLGTIGLAIFQALKLGEGSISLDDCIKNFIEGFSETAKRIQDGKEDCKRLMMSGKFDHLSFRFLMRTSKIYQKLLISSLTPERAGDKKRFSENINRLGNAYKNNRIPGAKEDIGEYEIECLERGNIPVFYIRFTDNRVYSYDTAVSDQMLAYTPREQFIREVEKFTDDKIRWWCYYIEKILPIVFEEEKSTPEVRLCKRERTDTAVSRLKLEKKIHDIYEKIRNKCIVTEQQSMCWMKKKHHGFYVSELDYYEGRPGIAKFLYYYGKTYDNQDAEKSAIMILETCLTRYEDIARISPGSMPVSLMEGISGLLLVFDQIEDESNRMFIESGKERLISLLKRGRMNGALDLYTGLAGIIYVLSVIDGDDRTVEMIEQYGKILLYSIALKKADSIDDSFAHGKAGIAYALMKAYQKTYNKEFKQKAIEFLDQCRIPEEEKIWGLCGGGAGMALAALEIEEEDQTDNIKTIIRMGEERCRMFSISGEESLCCGNTGLIALALKLLDITGETLYYESALELCDSNTCTTAHPGFMTGLSGIGYYMLRCIGKSDEMHERGNQCERQ